MCILRMHTHAVCACAFAFKSDEDPSETSRCARENLATLFAFDSRHGFVGVVGRNLVTDSSRRLSCFCKARILFQTNNAQVFQTGRSWVGERRSASDTLFRQ